MMVVVYHYLLLLTTVPNCAWGKTNFGGNGMIECVHECVRVYVCVCVCMSVGACVCVSV